MTDARDLDLVLFGATGFTGALTADYLARHAPAGTRWALAGRNRARLAEVRADLAEIDPALADLELLHADAAEPHTLKEIATRARVVISTVGPYLQYGEPLVAACAEHGADYVDLTGEPEFVDRMYVAWNAVAEGSGARLVHACGFDSVPHDLGTLFTIEQLRPEGPATVRGVVRAHATFSGGTFHSALGQMSRFRASQRAFRDRIKVQPSTPGRSSRAVNGTPHRDSELGLWLLPLPTIDAQVVARSGAALASYGPKFRYSHYVGIRRLPHALGTAATAGGMFAAAQVPPVRRLLLGRVPQGMGPDQSRRDKSWFTVDFIGEADGRTVHTRVSGGDPGYTETAKMLAESALCLAFDDNPPVHGQVTPAVAMGANLTERLQAAGMTFEVVD